MGIYKKDKKAKFASLGTRKVLEMYHGEKLMFTNTIDANISANTINFLMNKTRTCTISIENHEKFFKIGKIVKSNNNFNIVDQTLNSSGQLELKVLGVYFGTTELSFVGYRSENGSTFRLNKITIITINPGTFIQHPTLKNGIVYMYLFDGDLVPAIGNVTLTNKGGGSDIGRFGLCYGTRWTGHCQELNYFHAHGRGTINFYFKFTHLHRLTTNIVIIDGIDNSISMSIFMINNVRKLIMSYTPQNIRYFEINLLDYIAFSKRSMITIDTVGGIKLYIDNVLVGNKTVLTNNLFYGKIILLLAKDGNSFIEHLGIWNRSLTDGERADLYNDGNGIPYK